MNLYKNVLLTFDYELFLGEKSGSVQKCLIEPTKLILKILSAYNIKGIFFVDTTYLFKLNEQKKNNDTIMRDYKLVVSQLNELFSNGHYIYPHIHPHWINSKYNEKINQWDLSNTDCYNFSNLSRIKQDKIFSDSIDLLYQAIKSDKDYKIEGYRAGGWCIQPIDNFLPLFKQHGITAEFSVLPGAIADTNCWGFDFSKVKHNSQPYYFLDDESKMNRNGEFIEFPISSIKIKSKRYIDRISDAILWKLKFGQSFGNGIGVKVKNFRKNKPEKYINEMCSIENLTLTKLHLYKNFLRTNNYMHFISHPKMISPHNIYIFEKFVKSSLKNFKINFDWKYYQQ